MDIDEFFDKELGSAEKEEAETFTAQDFGGEEALKLYLELWKKLFDSSLKWDGSLYAKLSKTGSGIKNELYRLSSAVKRQKLVIRSLIDKAFRELETKNQESALRLYAEITDMRSTIPDFFLEDRREVNQDIFKLYGLLHDQIDTKFIESFKLTIREIENHISDSFSNIGVDNLRIAVNKYEKALKMYKELPNGFLIQKIKLGDSLLGLYKELSIREEIRKLQQEIENRPSKYEINGNDKLKELSAIIRTNKNKAK